MVTVTDDEDPTFVDVPDDQPIGTSTGGATPINLCDGFLEWDHPSVVDNCVGPYTMTVEYSGATVVAAALGCPARRYYHPVFQPRCYHRYVCCYRCQWQYG